MEIKLHEIPVRDLVKNYIDNAEAGVIGYDGRLDIRPPFQREFVYKDKERDAVIASINKGFPLNVMYWVSIHKNERFQVLDGQQRIVSICKYVTGEFSIDECYFGNLTETAKNRILDYKLMVYFCDGNDEEKLDWFKTINIAGAKLTNQEIRNAIYAGPWTTDAKRYFSKTGCPAYQIAEKYVKGSPIRQEFLETAIQWISGNNIERYMSKHQHDAVAEELWNYFKSVIDWIEKIFTNPRPKEMRGIPWGYLFETHKSSEFNPEAMELKVKELMGNDVIKNKSGIYLYVFDGKEKHLSLRLFTDSQKRTVYEKQNGKCKKCSKQCEINEMEAHHIKAWSKGGLTETGNCMMLCIECHDDEHSRK